MKFKEFKLDPSILRALKELKYENVSPIQRKTIPVVLNGSDLIGCSETGTGKTCAFAVPIIDRIISTGTKTKEKVIRALVVAPTRELAMQIFDSFRSYSKYNRIRSCVVFGAVGYRPQIEALKRGADILIATPGRLNDLIRKGYVDLSNIQFFVLDEADIMLDMGFVDDIKNLIKIIPKNRQTLMFSATMSKNILNLAKSILKKPVKAMTSLPSTTIDSIDQHVYMVEKQNKMKFLTYLINIFNIKSAVVFTRTKTEADKVSEQLLKNGIASKAIHSDKSQWDRLGILNDLKKGNIRILVATDIVSRGIDVKGISHVINYDIPYNSETYVHRIGRTGRAGKSGIAITLCENCEKNFLRLIENTIRRKIRVINSYTNLKNYDINNKFNISAEKNQYSYGPLKFNKKMSLLKYDGSDSQCKISNRTFVKNKNKAKSFDEWIKNTNHITISKKAFINSNLKYNDEYKDKKDIIVDFARRRSKVRNNKCY